MAKAYSESSFGVNNMFVAFHCGLLKIVGYGIRSGVDESTVLQYLYREPPWSHQLYYVFHT